LARYILAIMSGMFTLLEVDSGAGSSSNDTRATSIVVDIFE
jgi:hypothetical protein